jgi:hypothetical protein
VEQHPLPSSGKVWTASRRRVLTESQTRRHRFADVAAQAIPHKAHGTREMPIWGDRYAPEPSKALIPRPSENVFSRFLDPETVMRMRILVVIDYLNRIQKNRASLTCHLRRGLPWDDCRLKRLGGQARGEPGGHG